MIIKLSKYDGIYRILSLAKSEEAKIDLLDRGLSLIFLESKDLARILPDDVLIELNEGEFGAFSNSCEYDVFEVDAYGNAYKYFDNKSTDNAILVTNSCNSNCIMCPSPERIRRRKEIYYADTLIKLASHFPSDAAHITITGGEPFLIGKDIFRLLKFLKENIPNSSYLMLTNGRAFCIDEYARLLRENCPENFILGIPIHGYNAATHDFITQSDGSFEQTVYGLKNLMMQGISIELRIVVSKLNADYITKIAKMIVDKFNGISCAKIIGLEMTGNAAKNKETVWLSYKEAFKKAKNGIDLLISNGIDVGIYNFPLCSVDKEYVNICERSISPYKVRYADVCDRCRIKDACGGIFSGTIRMAKSDLIPVE